MKEKNRIIQAIREGDKSVVGELYKTLLPQITSYIKVNGGTTDDAKDIFQDAIMVLVRQILLNRFDEDKRVEPFIYTIAKNLWINKAKRDKKMHFVDELYGEGEYGDVITEHITNKEQKSVIEVLMKKVGEKCSRLMKAAIYDELSHKEIMEQFGYTNTNVVKTYMMRCKKKLKEIVKNNPHLREVLVG